MYPRLIALILLAQGSGSAFAGWLDDPLPQAEPAAQPAPQAEAQTQPGLTAPSPLIEIREQTPRMPTVDLTVPPDDLWERIRRGFSMPD
ncbi:MAG: lytic transglycosylase, partial [Rhodocyclales bacterium]|nr:lytic transglycosylase [Rhodocyclales bacterium]